VERDSRRRGRSIYFIHSVLVEPLLLIASIMGQFSRLLDQQKVAVETLSSEKRGGGTLQMERTILSLPASSSHFQDVFTFSIELKSHVFSFFILFSPFYPADSIESASSDLVKHFKIV